LLGCANIATRRHRDLYVAAASGTWRRNDWTPGPVTNFFRVREGLETLPDRREIPERMAKDPRMRGVYDELLRRSRQSGEFLTSSADSELSQRL
jgi:hypothetical protein